MSRIRRIEVPLRVTVAVAGLSIITVILAPLVLLFVDSILTVDWQRLTAIGQSFTGISALLSAAALVGVAFSIRLQNRQVELARAQAVLELQFAFEQLAVNDEQYWSVFVPTMLSDDSPADRKRKFLRNYMFRYFQFGHKTGEFSEADLRRMLSSFFANAENRQWWAWIKRYWEAGLQDSNPTYQKFVRIINDAYLACESSDESPEDGD